MLLIKPITHTKNRLCMEEKKEATMLLAASFSKITRVSGFSPLGYLTIRDFTVTPFASVIFTRYLPAVAGLSNSAS